jgi:peptidoglycan hydrolase-like protein with peptidoglycan-binding domain
MWADRDEAYVSVVAGVDAVARELLSKGSGLVSDWLLSRLLRRSVIVEVQRTLRQLDLYRGPVDGIPGMLTERALVEFQRSRGLTLDARVGPQVLHALAVTPATPQQTEATVETVGEDDPD